MSRAAADPALPREVLVTGASGFIGAHVCRALLDAGVATRALVRRGGGRAPAGVAAVEAADLTDAAALREAAAGVDAVVHLAGRAHVLREEAADPEAEFRRANVEGTRALLAAAAGAGARAFVLMSSVAAVATTSREVLTEAAPPRPDTPYGRSKRDAEALVARMAAEAGIRAPMLRPPMVYGPGMKGNPVRLFRLVSSGLPIPVPAAPNPRSVVYVGNLAAAVLALLAAPAADGPFFVRDARDLSTADMVRLAAAALGRPARTVPVPRALMTAAGRAGDLVSRVAHVPLSSDAVERFFGSLRVDASRLADAAGFRPPVAAEEAFRATAAWYRSIA